MSEMAGFLVPGTANVVDAAIGGNPNLEKASRASFGNTTRKKLGDISNLPWQGRALAQEEKSKVVPIATKEYVDQLQKENLALMKILAERNKLIEVTGIELQKLRINLQKTQQQNLQLARSNSQMLMELNSGKDRLKALQHELGCKNGLLKAMKWEVEEQLKVKKCEKPDDEVKLTNCKATRESSKIGRDDEKLENNRRTKSKSLGPSGQVQSNDETENKRPCVRRQSARFRAEVQKHAEDQLDVEDAKLPRCLPSNNDYPVQENGSTSGCLTLQNENKEGNGAPRPEAGKKRPCVGRQSARFKSQEPKSSEDDLSEREDAKFPVNSPSDGAVVESVSTSTCISLKNDNDEGNEVPGYVAQESRRSCINRPSRQAAKKVESYKEIPVNAKMRRDH